MNATPETTELDIQHRWGFEAPQVPTLSPDAELRADFFSNAPSGTLVEIGDELYARLPRGDWRHLEELTAQGGYYNDQEHASSTPEQMLKMSTAGDFDVYHRTLQVLVYRVGEPQSNKLSYLG